MSPFVSRSLHLRRPSNPEEFYDRRCKCATGRRFASSGAREIKCRHVRYVASGDALSQPASHPVGLLLLHLGCSQYVYKMQYSIRPSCEHCQGQVACFCTYMGKEGRAYTYVVVHFLASNNYKRIKLARMYSPVASRRLTDNQQAYFSP